MPTILRKLMKDQRGSLPQMTWTIGAAVVTALALIGAMVYFPDIVESFFRAATDWIRAQFGF
ncbi:MAG: hypothetical protein H0Z39_03475 [Peptococcaceae bacterium]|nr:hypothetical protein [Peptococcaceae bacterium]